MTLATLRPHWSNCGGHPGARRELQAEVLPEGGTAVVGRDDLALAQLVEQAVDDEVVLARVGQAAEGEHVQNPARNRSSTASASCSGVPATVQWPVS
jgi:hypothetical protein